MGRYFAASNLLPFLKMGVMFAANQAEGRALCSKDIWKRSVSGVAKDNEACLRTYGWMLSIP